MKINWLIILFLFLFIKPLFALPSVTFISVKQRFPWNGLVDIKCRVMWIDDSSSYMFSVKAGRYDEDITNEVSQFWVVQNGVKQSNFEVVEDGEYHLVWDAKADLGEVCYTNMAVIVRLEKDVDKVQLWEGGPYWAAMNIGAEVPWDYGYYFWWGDTIGYKRGTYGWEASDGSNFNFMFDRQNVPNRGKTVSTLKNEGWITLDGVLAPSHDAANVHWGKGWRMPTDAEFEALCSNCDWNWTTHYGVKGCIVKGRGTYASNSIFLPAAGYVDEWGLESGGSEGTYWSSVPLESLWASQLNFTSEQHKNGVAQRGFGKSVRPVKGFAK